MPENTAVLRTQVISKKLKVIFTLIIYNKEKLLVS
jgi:hypothetical protein